MWPIRGRERLDSVLPESEEKTEGRYSHVLALRCCRALWRLMLCLFRQARDMKRHHPFCPGFVSSQHMAWYSMVMDLRWKPELGQFRAQDQKKQK